MKNKENTIKCRFISPEEFENNNLDGTYFQNSVKIKSNGETTICCSEEIICSLAEHLNDGTLTIAKKETKYDGKIISYTFKGKLDKETTTKIIVNIPASLQDNIYTSFVRKDITQLDIMTNKTKEIDKLNKIKNALILSLISATLLLVSKNIDKQEAQETKQSTYDKYYSDTMPGYKFTEMAEELEQSAKKYLKTK